MLDATELLKMGIRADKIPDDRTYIIVCRRGKDGKGDVRLVPLGDGIEVNFDNDVPDDESE